MSGGISAPGGFGPRNKHLLKAIKRNTGSESDQMNSWTKARVAKFTFKKVSGGGGG